MENYYEYQHSEPSYKIFELIKYIDDLRKFYESEEEYLICGELRDYIQIFSDYCMGYVNYEDIREPLLNFLDAEALLSNVDIIHRTASFYVATINHTFTFYNLSYSDALRLERLFTSK